MCKINKVYSTWIVVGPRERLVLEFAPQNYETTSGENRQ